MKKEIKTKDLYLSPEVKVCNFMAERGFENSKITPGPSLPDVSIPELG